MLFSEKIKQLRALTIWPANQVSEAIEKDKEISDKVLDTAKQKLNY